MHAMLPRFDTNAVCLHQKLIMFLGLRQTLQRVLLCSINRDREIETDREEVKQRHSTDKQPYINDALEKQTKDASYTTMY